VISITFDIYTMISTIYMHPQYPILHQILKPYYQPRGACIIATMKKKNEEHLTGG